MTRSEARKINLFLLGGILAPASTQKISVRLWIPLESAELP